jgi:hypothetical protein
MKDYITYSSALSMCSETEAFITSDAAGTIPKIVDFVTITKDGTMTVNTKKHGSDEFFVIIKATKSLE